MLRRTANAPANSNLVPYPALDQPFELAVHPTGIRFYRSKGTFYCSYSTLAAMNLENKQLTLTFSSQVVHIHGEGLHTLYAHLANQRVSRIVEQGDSGLWTEGTFVQKIVKEGDDEA